MLMVTRRAADHLAKLRTDRGLDGRVGVRFVRNGARIGLTFTSKPEKDDRIVPRGGMPVYLAPGIAAALEQSVIDATTDEDRTWLVLRRQPVAP